MFIDTFWRWREEQKQCWEQRKELGLNYFWKNKYQLVIGWGSPGLEGSCQNAECQLCGRRISSKSLLYSAWCWATVQINVSMQAREELVPKKHPPASGVICRKISVAFSSLYPTCSLLALTERGRPSAVPQGIPEPRRSCGGLSALVPGFVFPRSARFRGWCHCRPRFRSRELGRGMRPCLRQCYRERSSWLQKSCFFCGLSTENVD